MKFSKSKEFDNTNNGSGTTKVTCATEQWLFNSLRLSKNYKYSGNFLDLAKNYRGKKEKPGGKYSVPKSELPS
jgi:hypothetical protein